jgi:hypothetical protein
VVGQRHDLTARKLVRHGHLDMPADKRLIDERNVSVRNGILYGERTAVNAPRNTRKGVQNA